MSKMKSKYSALANATPVVAPGDKKPYVVAAGVELICGRKVKGGDIVTLSDPEALYDLSLGRITLALNGAAVHGGA